MLKSDAEVAQGLFGRTVKLKATGGHKPDKAQLTALLADPEAKGRLFCCGCGHYSELTLKGVTGLAEDFSLVLPQSLASSYFLAERCLFCAERFQNVSVQAA